MLWSSFFFPHQLNSAPTVNQRQANQKQRCAEHNNVNTLKRLVLSLMLLARAASYHAFAQHAAAVVLFPHPTALPLLMCICSGENKNQDKNAAKKLIRYSERLKEVTRAPDEARAGELSPQGLGVPRCGQLTQAQDSVWRMAQRKERH